LLCHTSRRRNIRDPVVTALAFSFRRYSVTRNSRLTFGRSVLRFSPSTYLMTCPHCTAASYRRLQHRHIISCLVGLMFLCQ
jgi:hypothetical protein